MEPPQFPGRFSFNDVAFTQYVAVVLLRVCTSQSDDIRNVFAERPYVHILIFGIGLNAPVRAVSGEELHGVEYGFRSGYLRIVGIAALSGQEEDDENRFHDAQRTKLSVTPAVQGIRWQQALCCCQRLHQWGGVASSASDGARTGRSPS